jgi:hypothetical protein
LCVFLDGKSYHPFVDQLCVPWVYIPNEHQSKTAFFYDLQIRTLCFHECNFCTVIWPKHEMKLLEEVHEQFCAYNERWLHGKRSVLSTPRWEIPMSREFLGDIPTLLKNGQTALNGVFKDTVSGFSRPAVKKKKGEEDEEEVKKEGEEEEKKEGEEGGEKSEKKVIVDGAVVDGSLRSDATDAEDAVYAELRYVSRFLFGEVCFGKRVFLYGGTRCQTDFWRFVFGVVCFGKRGYLCVLSQKSK